MNVTEELWGLGRWEAGSNQVGGVAYSAVHHCTAGKRKDTAKEPSGVLSVSH